MGLDAGRGGGDWRGAAARLAAGAARSAPRQPARRRGLPDQGVVAHWPSYEWVHFASAGLFFGCLCIFCFFLFPRQRPQADGRINWSTPRNRIYRICGWSIVATVVFIGIYAMAGDATATMLRSYNYVFWWESVGTIAFARIMADQGPHRRGRGRDAATGGQQGLGRPPKPP